MADDFKITVVTVDSGSSQVLPAAQALDLVLADPALYRIEPPFAEASFLAPAILDAFVMATGRTDATYNDLLSYIRGFQGNDGPPGPAGPAGAGVAIVGTVADVGDLPPSANDGDMYILSTNGHGYVWGSGVWTDVGQIKGDTGSVGPGVPAGGTVGQIPVKLDDTDYNLGFLTPTKSMVGLGNVDNTSDANKPVSTAQATADADKVSKSATGTETMAGPLAAPYILPTYRGLRMSEFLTKNDPTQDDSAAFLAALTALGGGAQYTGLDLEGRAIGINGTVTAPAGLQGGVASKSKRIHGGRLIQLASQSVVSFSRTITTTLQSAVVVVSDATGLLPGMHVAAAGVGREVYIKSIVGTSLTLSQVCYASGTGVAATFRLWPYMLDFQPLNFMGNFAFESLVLDCGDGLCGGIRLGAGGGRVSFDVVRFLGVYGRGITDWAGVDPVEFNRIMATVSAAENAADPVTRTSIFACIQTSDVKFRSSQCVNFLHALVTHGNNVVYSANHSWQGGSSTSAKRTAQLVCTHKNWGLACVGNQIDNSYIELTDETYPYTNGPSYGRASIVGNTCVFNGDVSDPTNALDFSWIVVRPFVTGQGLRDMVISGNSFAAVQPACPNNYAEKIATDAGGSITSVDRVHMADNVYRNVSHPRSSRPTLSTTKTTVNANWNYDFTNMLAFGQPIARVRSSAVARLKDASTVQYDQPNITFGTADGLSDDFNARMSFAAGRKGTGTLTVDINANDF